MKKLFNKFPFFFFLAIMTTCLVTSCSSDDDDSYSGGGISGKWINKDFKTDIVDHYKLWKNDRTGSYVSDGSFAVFEFSGSSVKFYHYIYTFDGVLHNYPDKNHRYVKLQSANYNGVNVTWYADLFDTFPYALKGNSLIMGNGFTGIFEKGKLIIENNEYERY